MHIFYINSPVLMIKQQLVAAIKLTEYSSTKTMPLTIFWIYYNPFITDDQNEDVKCQYQDNILNLSDELLITADSDTYPDENAIFLPEEVADEVEDKTAKLS